MLWRQTEAVKALGRTALLNSKKTVEHIPQIQNTVAQRSLLAPAHGLTAVMDTGAYPTVMISSSEKQLPFIVDPCSGKFRSVFA